MSHPTGSQPRWSHQGTLSFALAVVLVILCAGPLVSCALGQSSCTVGVTGAAATMTIQGSDANSACDNEVAGHGLCAKVYASCYQYSSTPDTPEVCEADYSGSHYIVRDEGAIKFLGNELCQLLRSSNRAPTS